MDTPLTRAARLDPPTQARLLSGHDAWNTEAASEIGLGSMLMTDGPHGIRYESDDVAGSTLDGVAATCFPPAVSQASTWDPDLVREIGRAIAREARAQGIGVVLGPGLNIKRHPLGGRNFEYYSEDPVLSGTMAAAMVDGIQSLGVGACVKHFAVNNQETNRFVVDAIVDERTLREIYLAGFEHAVTHAAPWTVMAAYNLLNGAYCTENRWLLTDVLRDEWGFDGLVMSDWGAVNDRPAGIAAGCDLEMPGNRGLNDPSIVAALADGRLSTEAVETSIGRLIDMVERADSGREHAVAPLDLDRHHRLARRAAAAGCVLLTNDGTLPLGAPNSIAVIGAFATQPRFQGAGSSQITPTQVDSPLDEIRALAGDANVSYAPGYTLDGDDPHLIEAAAAAARDAEVAVVFVGLPDGDEAESFDRDHLRLPERHDELVAAVCDANPRTVVVLFNGSPVTMPWVARPTAIVEAYLGGQAVGGAVADVLFGIVNPSGRLAETFPLLQRDIGADPWFPGEGRQVEYREGLYVGYRWFDSANVEPLFCFGHGLSYTSFEYGPIARDGHSVVFSVTNVGDRAGAEVAQVYVRKQGGVVHAPMQALRAFRKVHLEPGETAELRIDLDVRAFQYWDVAADGWRIDPTTYEIAVGASSRDIRGATTVDITADIAGTAAPDATAADEALHTVTPSTIGDASTFAALLGRPIPVPTPRTRFDRNSTFGEIRQHRLGAPLYQAALTAAKRQFKADTPLVNKMVERSIAELPVRSFALIGGGRIRFEMVDRVLAALNATNGATGRVRRLLQRRTGR